MNFRKPNFEVGSESSQVRKEARKELPKWLHQQLDHHNEVLLHQIQQHLSDNHLNEELFDKLRYNTAEEAHLSLPNPLKEQLETPLPVEIPEGAQRYFGTFSDQVKHQITILDAEEVISAALQEKLAEKPTVPAHYFSNFADTLSARVLYLATDTPIWLDHALQSVACMPVPNGYFDTFSHNVKDTVEAIEELALIEKEEPTTIERLIQTPDHFTQLLDLVEQSPLPLGQELYFEDFSARVRQKVRGRQLDAKEKVKPLRILHPAMKWGIAACFAVVTVTGTTWLLPASVKQSLGISPKTQKVQVQIQGKAVELNLQKAEAEKLSQILKIKAQSKQ